MSIGLASMTLVVHAVRYVLGTSFWNDEIWVAISLKVPLHDVPTVIASTPIGWDLLLRAVPMNGTHPEGSRVIPLIFAALTVIAAYWYLRLLPWRTQAVARLAAVAGAVMALLSPSALLRNDLKQYTCDAFCVLVVLMLTAHAERTDGWKPLAVLTATASVLFLFANPAGLALLAALASLGIVAAARRDWKRLRQVVVSSLCAVAALGATYVLFYAHGNIPGLRQYWESNYVPVAQGPVAMWHWFWGIAPAWFHVVGVGPVLIALPLFVLGTIAIGRLGLPATGVTVLTLLIEMVCLAAMRQYPIFDVRTMHFLAIAYAVTVAAGAVYWITWLNRGAIGIAATLAVIAATVAWHGQGIRQHSIPGQPTGEDVAALKAGYRPGDVILANVPSTWSIAYYWGGPVRIVPSAHSQQKFRAYAISGPAILDLCPEKSDGSGDIVLPHGNPLCDTAAGIHAALDRAWRATGPAHRIFFYNLQGRHADFLAIRSWAIAHHYALVRPNSVPGTMLNLLMPRTNG